MVVVDVLPEPDPEVWGKPKREIYMSTSPLNNHLIAHLQFAAEVTGARAIYQQLDVQDESSITSAFAKIVPQLRNPIRGLVSCAAISGESDACDYPADVFRKILDINITGTFLIARCVANEMQRANVPGSIVLIASMSGHISNRGINTSAYNAYKAAVHQLARSLAAEWGHPQNTFPGSTASATNPNPSTEPRLKYPPIRVNTLSPGHIETPMSAAARERGLTEEWAKQNMLGRISQPEEYRGPVLFLLGDGSSYMTGAVSSLPPIYRLQRYCMVPTTSLLHWCGCLQVL